MSAAASTIVMSARRTTMPSSMKWRSRGPYVPVGPRPLVVQRSEHGEVLAAGEHLDGDGPPVDGILTGTGPGTQ